MIVRGEIELPRKKSVSLKGGNASARLQNLKSEGRDIKRDTRGRDMIFTENLNKSQVNKSQEALKMNNVSTRSVQANATIKKTARNIKNLSMTLGKQLEGYKNGNLLSRAYSYPKNISIDGQEPKEKIILIFRSHPIVVLPRILQSLVLIVCAIIVAVLFKMSDMTNLGVGVGILLILAGVSNFIFTYIYWFYNVNIITTERIIDMDFSNIGSYRMSEAQIEKVEDISVANEGFFASMFNYGTIYVQTAAEEREFEFENVAEPNRIQDILGDLMELKQKGVKI